MKDKLLMLYSSVCSCCCHFFCGVFTYVAADDREAVFDYSGLCPYQWYVRRVVLAFYVSSGL